MRTVRLILILLIPIFMYSQIQSDHAVGLRLGASDGFVVEISYQYNVNNKNRFEFNFGWKSADSFDGYRLLGLYEWVFNINQTFNWYVGGGPGYSNYNYITGGSEGFPFIAALIGLEFQTNIPLQITADLRPQFNINDSSDVVEVDFGIGVRYKF